MSANILVVDDDESMRTACSQTLSEAGYRVQSVSNGTLALEKVKKESFDVIVLDLKMPGIPGIDVLKALTRDDSGLAVIVITGYGSFDAAMQAGKFGAFEFLAKPFDPDKLISLVEKAASRKRFALEDSCVRMAVDDQETFPDKLVGESAAIRRVVRLIKKAAPMDSTVLITGETGSGKELVARLIHRQSMRREKPFVVVDCGSLVPNLFESEMFGHVKGSFTGAVDNTKGKLELAHSGTLFLDEVGNIDLNLQARLLRVVQEQEFAKVGSSRTKKLNVRIIAATNQDLSEEIEQGRFRKDLFYRLNVVVIHIPKVEERPEDIPLLAQYFLHRFCAERRTRPVKLSEESLALMQEYSWPGNVRELKNAIERAIVISDNGVLGPGDLMLSADLVPPEPSAADHPPLAIMEMREIVKMLRECKGNRGQAAMRLGINRKTLREKIRKYGISVEDFAG